MNCWICSIEFQRRKDSCGKFPDFFTFLPTQSLGVNELVMNVTGHQPAMHSCQSCGRRYRHKENLLRHIRVECGKEAQFQCHSCHYKSKHKHCLLRHLRCVHNEFIPQT